MASLEHPANLKYSKTDEWVRVDGDEVTIGITDYAQDQLGDIVYIELPWHEGDQVGDEAKFGDVESVKATSELVSPVSGSVIRANESLKENPELVNESPYDEGWLLVIKLSNTSELDKLMSAGEYQTYLQSR